MAKTKFKKLHKIKLHPNRWLIWAIAYILFVGLALIGYLKISNINIDTENLAANVFTPALSFNDKLLGFALRYPSNWAIEADSANSVTFLPTENSDNGVAIIVTTPSSEKSIRKSLKIKSETTTVLGSVTAAQIVNDLGQGHTETVIIGTYNNKLYVLRGSSNLVQQLLLTFHFLPKSK